jgi:hypothetical protein
MLKRYTNYGFHELFWFQKEKSNLFFGDEWKFVIEMPVNIQYIFLVILFSNHYIFLIARRAYSWLFQLAQMWKLLAPGVGLGDFLTPALYRKNNRKHEVGRLCNDRHFQISGIVTNSELRIDILAWKCVIL